MYEYLDLVDKVLSTGTVKESRTGTSTLSIFGQQLTFDLTEGFPLVTTKAVSFKNIVTELLWFLSGDTNIKFLKDNGCNIWNEWADENGDLGPVYGHQWRSWNGSINQIDGVIYKLKHTPYSRRIIINAWNVEYLPEEGISPQSNVRLGLMALPPCHVLYQFYVADGYLSCQVYIRSSDVFLGMPYNIASAALLTEMLAGHCGLEPHKLVVAIGDAHLYSNHINQAEEQLGREPKKLPELSWCKADTIYDQKIRDFSLIGYEHWPKITAPISI